MTNLSKIIKNIPIEYFQKGNNWYIEANKFATELSETFYISFDKVCGVISALSPANNWDNNKKEARKLIECYVSGDNFKNHVWRTYSANVVKAWEILRKYEPTEKFFSDRTGYKTLAFYHNIKSPTDDKFVTIDRHMIAIFEGRLGQPSGTAKLTTAQYRAKMSEFIKLAKRFKLTPCALQATLWEYHLKLIEG